MFLFQEKGKIKSKFSIQNEKQPLKLCQAVKKLMKKTVHH